MHELSIAMEIVEIAELEMAKVNALKVDVIELDIGTLAGIEFDALDFVWPSAVKGSVLEQATKKINIIQGEAKCKDCSTLFKVLDIYDPCPTCNGYQKEIIAGKEFVVKRLEVNN